jgi:hypothetical protein
MDDEDAQLEYTINLGRDEPREVIPGLRELGRELRGARFGKSGATGVADSVQAVQEANLLQVPPYAIVAGRAIAAREEPTWKTFVDTLGERLTLEVRAGQYDGIDAGLYVVDLIGAGLFMPRHDVIRAAVKGNELNKGAIQIKSKDKNLLLGEKHAYRWDGREVKKGVPVQFFGSYEAFLEASTGADFKQGLQDMTAIYAVLRPVAEAQKNPSGYRNIDVQLNNPDGIIPSGGKAPWQKMLGQMTSFEWNGVGSHHDGYSNVDTGRPVVLNGGYGIRCHNSLDDDGGSVGVAPEALKARSAARKTTLDTHVDAAITNGRSFEYNGRLYVPVQADTGVQLVK